MKLLNKHWVRYQFFKIKSMEGDDKMKAVHWNLMLPLFSDPSDQASKSDTKSMVYQTESAQEAIVKGAIASHVHNLSTYGSAQVTSCFREDWSLLQLCLNNGNTVIYWARQEIGSRVI